MKMSWARTIKLPTKLALVVLLSWSSSVWAANYFVSTTGLDTNPGTVGSPWRTIQKAANTAVAGDTVSVGAGIFEGQVTFPTSGTSGSRITFQGTLGAGNVLLTTIDGSSATSGWVAQGSGVWRASLGSPGGLTATFGGAQRTIWRIHNDCMTGSSSNCLLNGMTALQVSADATVNTAVTNTKPPCGPGNTCTMNYWDGVEAMFGNLSGQTYLRFRNGTDPATMNVRSAPAGGVLRLLSKNFITIKNFRIVGGEYGIEQTGSSQGNIFDGNDIRHGFNQVKLHLGGGSNTTIQNNFLTPDSIGAVNFTPGDRNGQSYTRAVSRRMYDIDKFLIGTSEIRHAAIELAGGSGTQVLNNEIAYGIVGTVFYSTTSNTTIRGNNYHNFADIGIYLSDAFTSNLQITENNFYDSFHHMRIESTNQGHTGYIWANTFFNPWYNSSGGTGKHIFIPPHSSGSFSPMTFWIYQNSFAGGGWAVDFGGCGEGTFCYPNVQVLNNFFSTNGISSCGTGALTCSSFPGELAGNMNSTLWYTNTIPSYILPTTMRNQATSLIPRGIPGMTTAYYEDGLPDHGAIQGDETPPPTQPDPGVALDITHQCASSPNSLNASVLGSLFYLPSTVIFDNTKLVQASCASQVSLTDVASVVTSGYPSVRPFHFMAGGVSPTGNTCTNCLSVHNGTGSSNESGSGWTLDTFQEASSVSGATGGDSPYLELPGLCKRYVDGTLTTDPLWPWAMNQRILDAMVLAGKPPINVTTAVETILGPIPDVCKTTDPLPEPPPPQTTWVIAPASASPPGVDGQACTLEAPCATIAHVAGRMTAGNTLYLRGGTYTQNIDSGTAAIPGGTSWSAATTIAAYGSEVAILTYTPYVGVWFRNPVTDHYIVVDRLIFDGTSTAEISGMAFQEGTHHIRVQNCVFRNNYYEHMIVNGGDQIQVLNTTFTDNAFVSSIRLMGDVDSLKLDGNTFTNSAQYGIQTLETNVTNSQIVRNIFHDLTLGGMDLGRGLVGSMTGTLIANNLLYDNGLGLLLGPLTTGTKVYNNTIADHTGNGLQLDTGATGTLLTNNIVYGNGSNIVNNGTGTVQTTNLTTDPGFVGSGNYHIAAGSSPAVNAGTTLAEVTVDLDGVARPQGVASDIGAYERDSDPPGPPPPPTGFSALPTVTGQFLMLP